MPGCLGTAVGSFASAAAGTAQAAEATAACAAVAFAGLLPSLAGSLAASDEAARAACAREARLPPGGPTSGRAAQLGTVSCASKQPSRVRGQLLASRIIYGALRQA